jgi:hypothetical protein
MTPGPEFRTGRAAHDPLAIEHTLPVLAEASKTVSKWNEAYPEEHLESR